MSLMLIVHFLALVKREGEEEEEEEGRGMERLL